MVSAEYSDKELVVNILARSFETNKSVNYIAKQDSKRKDRIKSLMEYSFDICHSFGNVFLSSDKKACALVLFPDKKRTTFKSVLLDIKLIVSCIGISNIRKALNREARIKQIQHKVPMYYLWFVGVDPDFQGEGIGSTLLKDLIQDSIAKNRSIYLETSTIKNLPWYSKFGFVKYNELNLSYQLFFLKRDVTIMP